MQVSRGLFPEMPRLVPQRREERALRMFLVKIASRLLYFVSCVMAAFWGSSLVSGQADSDTTGRIYPTFPSYCMPKFNLRLAMLHFQRSCCMRLQCRCRNSQEYWKDHGVDGRLGSASTRAFERRHFLRPRGGESEHRKLDKLFSNQDFFRECLRASAVEFRDLYLGIVALHHRLIDPSQGV